MPPTQLAWAAEEELMTHSSLNNLRAQEYKITKIPKKSLEDFFKSTNQNSSFFKILTIQNLNFLTN
jgi:hypothetical protein